MAYNENIPQSSDNPSQSQSQLLGNFQEINTAFNLNHGNFNAAQQGKHELVDFVRQSLPQSANVNEGLLFSALASGATELFFGRDGATATKMTGVQPSTGGGTSTSFSWDFINGLNLRFGNVTHTGFSTSITFESAFSNTAYIVLFSPIGNAALVTANNVQNLTTTGFSLNSSSSAPGGSSYYYLALGR